MTRFVFLDVVGSSGLNVTVKTNIDGFTGSAPFTPRNGLVMDIQGLASDSLGIFAKQGVGGARILAGRKVQTSDLVTFAQNNLLQLTAVEEGNVANTPTTIAQALAIPGNFVATPISTTQINLACDAVTHASTYKFERATNAAFTTGLTTLQNTSTRTFNDTGRTASTLYYYRVSAIATGYTTSGYATDTQGGLLAAPGSFANSVISATEIDLTWLASSQATNYIVDRATNVGFTTGVALGIYSGPLLTYHNTGLTTGTQYFYRIRAQGTNFGDSAYATTNGTTS